MKFDMSDVRVRWQLYRYHNRCHNGEVWLVFSTSNVVRLMEQSGRFPDDSVLLGEVRTRGAASGLERKKSRQNKAGQAELTRRRKNGANRARTRASSLNFSSSACAELGSSSFAPGICGQEDNLFHSVVLDGQLNH